MDVTVVATGTPIAIGTAGPIGPVWSVSPVRSVGTAFASATWTIPNARPITRTTRKCDRPVNARTVAGPDDVAGTAG